MPRSFYIASKHPPKYICIYIFLAQNSSLHPNWEGFDRTPFSCASAPLMLRPPLWIDCKCIVRDPPHWRYIHAIHAEEMRVCELCAIEIRVSIEIPETIKRICGEVHTQKHTYLSSSFTHRHTHTDITQLPKIARRQENPLCANCARCQERHQQSAHQRQEKHAGRPSWRIDAYLYQYKCIHQSSLLLTPDVRVCLYCSALFCESNPPPPSPNTPKSPTLIR